MCGLIFLPFLQACALRELLALRFTSGLTCAARLECNLRFHLDAAASRSGRATALWRFKCPQEAVQWGRVSTEEFSTSEKLLLLDQKALVLSERLLMFLLQVLVVRELFMWNQSRSSKHLHKKHTWTQCPLAREYITICTSELFYTQTSSVFRKKDIGLLLLLQLVLPEVIPLQLMLDDVHTQGPNLKMCDQAVELGETREEIKMERERERKRLPFIQKWILKNVFGGIPAGSCHWNDPIRHPSSSLHSKLSKSKHVQSNSMSWSDL